jgi:hypothetical protein
MDDFPFLIPFLGVVNVYETDIAALISASMQSMVSKRRVPIYRFTSWSWNGVSLLVVPVYSPVCNKKKNVMATISAIACVSLWRDAPYACESIKTIILIGTGLPLLGGESSILQAHI